LLTVDAAGTVHTSDGALSELHAIANAPIFGTQSSQLGKGIVGGPLLAVEALSRKTAAVAVRLLNNEAPENIKVPPQRPGPAAFDWRELRRWNIDEDRLPSGSIIRFRSPTVWEAYKWHVIVGVSLSVFGTILVFGLLINLVKRKRVAERAQDFNRRLIQAQEAERSKLAGELHEDITQRLACLAIEIKQEATARATTGTMGAMHEEVVRLCEDVRSMAYKLHPSLIQHLGFVGALQIECEKFSGQTGIAVDAKFQNIQEKLPIDAGLCLFRVAEEALRNVSCHSQAKAVIVHLTAERGGMRLVITDNGVGFDLSQRNSGATLGLPSMRERVQLLAGNFEIQSKPGHGTTISAWIPLTKEDKQQHTPSQIA
jgi:signal transduction histidine kinase